MNILIVSSGEIPHIGGKSTHILDLKDGIEELGHKACIISENDISYIYKVLGRIIRLPIRIINKYEYIHSMQKYLGKQLSTLCSKKTCDYIITQDAIVASSICGDNRIKTVKKYLTMHTYFALENKLDGKKISKKTYEKMNNYEQACMNDIDGIVCVDKRIRESVEKIVREKNIVRLEGKIEDIPNFTNINRFKPINLAQRNILREKYGVDKEKFVCVCARRLVEKNGVIYAVKAMKELDDRYVLLIAGNGPERVKIEKYVEENDISTRVRFLNNIPNEQINEFYQLADVSIVPSITAQGLQEATSITAIESMACGIPTIASNIGGLVQLIESNKTGILVNECKSEEIAEAILKLNEQKKLYDLIRENSVKYIGANHSHIEGAKKYLNIYDIFEKLE